MPARPGKREKITPALLGALHRAMKDAGLDYHGVAEQVNLWLLRTGYKANPVGYETIKRIFEEEITSSTILYPLKAAMGIRDGKFATTFDEDIMEAVEALESIKHLDRDTMRKIVAQARQQARAVHELAAKKAALDAQFAQPSAGPVEDESEKKKVRVKRP